MCLHGLPLSGREGGGLLQRKKDNWLSSFQPGDLQVVCSECLFTELPEYQVLAFFFSFSFGEVPNAQGTCSLPTQNKMSVNIACIPVSLKSWCYNLKFKGG